MKDINTEANYFIATDMDSGYCKVVAEEEAQERLALFTLYRKQQSEAMPMGDIHADPTFLVISMKLQMGWETLAKERGLKNVAS